MTARRNIGGLKIVAGRLVAPDGTVVGRIVNMAPPRPIVPTKRRK